ncbi:MAG: hypothetical protein ACRDS9_24180 [Pseudonocardiaceae bacterium]
MGGRGRVAWSGRVGQGAEASEDLGEEVVAGWEAQDELAGVADQPAGDAQQAVPRGVVIMALPSRTPQPASGWGVLG